MMRLLVLNWRDLRHPRAGGSEVYAQKLAAVWASEGHDVTLFTSAPPGLPASEKLDGYTIIRRGGSLTVYREARRWFRNSACRFDAILEVVNTRPFLAPLWAGEVPTVTLAFQVARDVWRYEVPWPGSVIGQHLLEPRWLAAYKDRTVLTISESSRKSFEEYGLRQVVVIPVGADEPLSRPIPDKASTPTCIFVGRLAANKRPDDALEAHRLLRQSLPDARLWVVGDGPLASRLRREAAPGATLFGRVDAAMKQDLMASAHALVATSVREGWGMTVSEAALLGTRSVAYDVPGLRDSVPVCGGVLTEPTPEALSRGLAACLPGWMQEGRAHLGNAGVVPWTKVGAAVMDHLLAAGDP